MPRGWDDPAVAHAYRAFEGRHPRYRRANAALAAHAAIAPGMRVLDLAAGTGGTSAALRDALGDGGRIHCVEPAAAMAAAGRERLGADPRVSWHGSLRDVAGCRFDRIVCGAAIWQWPDIARLVQRLSRLLAPGGALVFDIPAAYLGEPDGPGGGADPYLTALLAAALASHPATGNAARGAAPPSAAGPAPRTAQDIDEALRAAGLIPRRWRHRQRLSQAAWRDWLCLPVLSAPLWPDAPAPERTRRIQAAAAQVDARSWRPEGWLGWTAWKPACAVRPLAGTMASIASDRVLRQRARRDGVLLLRGAIPQRPLTALRRIVQAAGQAEGLLDGRGRWIGGSAGAPHEIPRWLELQQRVAQTAQFQALVASKDLLAIVARVIGGPARPGLGSVCRIAAPEHQVKATPAHCDAQFLRESLGVWGAWLPLEPCDVADGVLAVAPGSHRGNKPRWAAAPMLPGDVLLVNAQTLHRGCPNLRLREPRLSIDLRFGPARAQPGE